MFYMLFSVDLMIPREKSGQRELEVLAKLRTSDPDNKYHCLTLYRSFTHRNHLCLVFESLRLDLQLSTAQWQKQRHSI